MFYANYGKYVHSLLARFYTGEIDREQALTEFLTNFHDEIKGVRPNDRVLGTYIEDAVNYLCLFKPLPFETVAVERKIDFSLGGKRFTAILDYIGRDSDGSLVIVDHKSRRLKQRNGKKPTKHNLELDSMLRQLYLYSAALKAEFGELPKTLCFNCFRTNLLIQEPFKQDVYEKVIQETLETIRGIEDALMFAEDPAYFKCTWLCEVREQCDARFVPKEKEE